MSHSANGSGRHQHLIQRRISAAVDHLRPHGWNWSAVVQPLDRSLAQRTAEPMPWPQLRSLRFFWLDGLFSAISDHFQISFVALYALAYGATAGQVGMLAAAGNLMGALALFPGAQLLERTGRRKQVVLWSGGGVARLMLLLLGVIPLVTGRAGIAIAAIIALYSVRAFAANLSNPAWTSLVADLVPGSIRGRYFSSRNVAMGLAALVVAPLAGRIIGLGNRLAESAVAGYQVAFFLSFAFGIVGTICFGRIQEPAASSALRREHHRGDLRRALKDAPGYVGFVISAFVFNLALQVAAPFFNIYLVTVFQAVPTTIGLLAAVSSTSALVGQQVFGRLLDRKGELWVQQVTGFLIPLLPLAWMFITAPWQVAFVNTLGGFSWAGYNLSNFNLLLTLTPESQRPRAVALYQTAVFGSAVVGPLIGGALINAVGFKVIFGVSGAGRIVGMLLFLRLTARVVRAAAKKGAADAS